MNDSDRLLAELRRIMRWHNLLLVFIVLTYIVALTWLLV